MIGLSFHVGSQVNSAKRHVEAIEQCKKILNHAQEKGLGLKILDIGGGFPVDYDGNGFDIYSFCEPIRKALAGVPKNIKLLAEPGRFISAPCITSVSSVMGKAL